MLNYLRRQGFARGVMGSSRGWLAFWILLTALRMVRKAAGRREEVVYREELRPGERILIRHYRESDRPA